MGTYNPYADLCTQNKIYTLLYKFLYTTRKLITLTRHEKHQVMSNKRKGYDYNYQIRSI